jgi:hypothetical protein
MLFLDPVSMAIYAVFGAFVAFAAVCLRDVF